jgi:hypothetical protein
MTIVPPNLDTQLRPFMSNETIFREVDEELRGDRMRAIWKRFGPYLIGTAVAVVLLVAVNEGWSWWQNSQAAAASDKFYAALEIADGTDVAAAEKAFADVEATAPAGYATLAKFRQAGLLAKSGKTDEAVAAYDALATSESNQQLKSLALVFAANLFVDKGDVAAVQQRVQGLAVAGNPMRNAARETLGLAQYKAGDLDAAVATLTEILNDPLTGQEMAGRIQIYVAQLIALGAKAPSAAEAAATAIDTAVSGTETTPAAVATPATDAAPAADATPSVGDAPAMDVTAPAPAAGTTTEGAATGN